MVPSDWNMPDSFDGFCQGYELELQLQRINSIILPNSNLNSKKYFFWTRTWTRINLLDFIRKIFKL